MLIIHLLYDLQNILVLILSTRFILEVYCQEISDRTNPGCVLVNDHIHCYGGLGTTRGHLNDNLELDLSEFGDFSILNKSKIKWKSNSKSINGYDLPSVVQPAATNLSDETILFYGGISKDLNNMPFIHFNPKTNTWNNIQVPNNTYFVGNQIVNIGNDKIWIYGGNPPEDTSFISTFYIYDYKNNNWSIKEPMQGTHLSYYSATLRNDIIYIIGGFHSRTNYTPLNQFKTYNTTNGEFGNLTTLGSERDGRLEHSTTLTSDKKYILIYGGVRIKDKHNLFLPCVDVYYIYDISSNTLKHVPLYGSSQLSIVTRYRHYATIYKSNYLLLVFGISDGSTSTDSLNVLNVQDPFNPKWVEIADMTSNNIIHSEDTNKIIPAVIISVIIALSISAVIVLFFIMKSRKKRQKKAFQLVQEDPRNNAINNKSDSHFLSTGEPSTAIEPVVGTSDYIEVQKKYDQMGDDGYMYYEKLYEDNMMKFANQDVIKPSEYNYVKPSENSYIKPSENNSIKPTENI